MSDAMSIKELFSEIYLWSFSAVYLTLMIYSLIRIGGNAKVFFAVGFGVSFLSSLSWRVIQYMEFGYEYPEIYEILQVVSFISVILFLIMFILGINEITKPSSVNPVHLGQHPGVPVGGERGLWQDGMDEEDLAPVYREYEHGGNGLFSFSGRIGRGTYWAIWFVSTVLSAILGAVLGFLGSQGKEEALLAAILLLLSIIPITWIGLAMQVKRWHDRDKSGWMVLIGFIPIIGPLWAFIELGFLEGTRGPNRFGNPPA